jgi:hypothetical protein
VRFAVQKRDRIIYLSRSEEKLMGQLAKVLEQSER